jgi:hypothetical protein
MELAIDASKISRGWALFLPRAQRNPRMKLKIVIVDFEIPPRVKRWALYIGIPAALLLGGGAIAYATGTLPTFTTNETLQASDLNTLSSAIAALQTSVAALQTQVVAHAHFGVAQELPYGTLEVLNFDTKDFDTGSAMTTNPMVFTAPSAGTYRVSVGLSGECGNDTGAGGGVNVVVFRDGASLAVQPDGGSGPTGSFAVTLYYSASDNGWGVEGSDLVTLNTGDTLTLEASQDLCSSSANGSVNYGQVAIEKVSNGN